VDRGRSLAGTLAKLLDRLVKCERLPSERQDAALVRIAAAVRDLPREDLFRALPEAIGNNQRRRRVAVHLLAELSEAEGAVEQVGRWFGDPDPEWQAWLVQTIEEARLVEFAPALSWVIEHDPDPLVRKMAIHAAGELRSEANLPALLGVAKACPRELLGYVLWALKEYGHEDCRAALLEVFRGPDEIETARSPPLESAARAEQRPLSALRLRLEASIAAENRVVAAWGLGKLGEPEAIQYLGQLLEGPGPGVDPDVALGQSLRAAQALCDLFGWPFQWHRDWVQKTRTLWRSRQPRGS
jgi:HEAT repeats/PBS lyase HEAT-like repeat